MRNITYGVTEEPHSLGAFSHTSYGIAAYADSAEDGTDTIIASVHDGTIDRHALAELVSLCNRLELSTVHLMEMW